MDLINNIWIINLDRQESKKNHMIQQINNLPTNLKSKVKFFSAIDGRNLTNQTFDIVQSWSDPYHKTSLKTGEVGCALSHWEIWNNVDQGNDPRSFDIILEDDVIIDIDFADKLEKNLEILRYNNVDMVYLHRKMIGIAEKVFNMHPKINYANYSYWTCGYMVTPPGAHKLIQSKFNQHIIPVDEFLPIMYNSSNIYAQYSNYYPNAGTLIAVALDPSILRLTSDAFSHSETISSDIVTTMPKNAKNNDSLLILGIGSSPTDGRNRFEDYCKLYGLNYRILGDGVVWKMDMSLGPGGGQKVNILKEALESIDENQLILLSDTYDVIPLSNEENIVKKYLKVVEDDREKILFSAEYFCWPNKSLAQKYPKRNDLLPRFLNSGGFMGKAGVIRELLRDDHVSDMADDQGYYTKKYLDGLSKIVLDHGSEIFQTLGGSFDKVKINTRKGNLQNMMSKSEPCFVHGNGNISVKLQLNYLENYLGNNWNENYGYINKFKYERDEVPVKDPKIFVALFSKKISTIDLNYSNIEIKHYSKLTYSTGQQSINDFLRSNSEIYFNLEADKVKITNPNFIRTMISRLDHKRFIAPLFVRKNKNWSNFWGAINDNGYYKRSDDYFDILRRTKKGIWNVPYITSAFLIKREVLSGSIDHRGQWNPYNKVKGNDVDMAICHNLRSRGVMMYLDNLEDWGYINPEDISIFNYEQDKMRWVKSYMDEDFVKDFYKDDKLNLEKFEAKQICSDVFTFKIFNSNFCNRIIQLVEEKNIWSPGLDNHKDPRLGGVENVPTQDIHLNQFGFEKVWKQLVHDVFSKIASKIYSPYKTKGINIAFVVKYSMDGQKELRDHHDSSTYTINLALNQSGIDFQGGGCHFVRQKYSHVNANLGEITIHPGRLTHYHRGLPITAGNRYILVSFIN